MAEPKLFPRPAREKNVGATFVVALCISISCLLQSPPEWKVLHRGERAAPRQDPDYGSNWNVDSSSSKVADSASLSNGGGSVAYTPELEECSTNVMPMQMAPRNVE